MQYRSGFGENVWLIRLIDMARYRDSERVDYIIQNWMRNRNTIEFLGLWEQRIKTAIFEITPLQRNLFASPTWKTSMPFSSKTDYPKGNASPV